MLIQTVSLILGDVIKYTITVENKGNVILTGITLTDTLKDNNGGNLTLKGVRNLIQQLLVQLKAPLQ